MSRNRSIDLKMSSDVMQNNHKLCFCRALNETNKDVRLVWLVRVWLAVRLLFKAAP